GDAVVGSEAPDIIIFGFADDVHVNVYDPYFPVFPHVGKRLPVKPTDVIPLAHTDGPSVEIEEICWRLALAVGDDVARRFVDIHIVIVERDDFPAQGIDDATPPVFGGGEKAGFAPARFGII